MSHQIRALEAHLGVTLFHRMTRAVRLTEAGQAYFPPLRDAFAGMAEATAALAAARAEGPLTISVAPSFAIRWLVPHLHAFEARHPEIELRSAISVQQVELRAGDVAAAIRHGRGVWPGLVAHCLLVEDLVAVCAPSLLQQGEDVAALPPLQVEPRRDDWPVWCAAAGRAVPPPGPGRTFPTLALALDAAAAGLGVAVADRRLVARDIAQGRLALAAPDIVASDSGYFLVHRPARADDPKLGAFRDWLFETVAAEAAPDAGA